MVSASFCQQTAQSKVHDGVSTPPSAASSIVGYNSKTITADTYYLMAFQFENINSDGLAGLNDVINMTGVSAVGIDDAYTTGAEIMVRVGSGYKSYYYINDAWDTNDHEVEGNVWADGDGYVVATEDLQALGDGFWLLVRSGALNGEGSITIAGAVSNADELTKSFSGTAAGYFTIIANPFPLATQLNSITQTGLTAMGIDDAYTKGVEVMVRVGNGYKSYYYINDAWDAEDHEVEGNVWADGDGYVATETDAIGVGASFWVKSFTNGSLTFSK